VTRYVTDTHALVWHLTEDERLPLTCRTAFAGADQSEVRIWIPAIVLVEVIYLAEKSRVPSSLVERMLEAVDPPRLGYMVAALDVNVARNLVQIPRDVLPDMPDRIIAVTALTFDAPLLTKDSKIRAVPGLTTIWDS
jgi:PIN domain nuclease of toxin-antitoxin system